MFVNLFKTCQPGLMPATAEGRLTDRGRGLVAAAPLNAPITMPVLGIAIFLSSLIF